MLVRFSLSRDVKMVWFIPSRDVSWDGMVLLPRDRLAQVVASGWWGFLFIFLGFFLVLKTEDWGLHFCCKKAKTVVFVKKKNDLWHFYRECCEKHNRRTLRIKFWEHATNGEDKPQVWRPPLRSVNKTMTWYLVSPPPMSYSWTLLNLVECVRLTAAEVNGLPSKQETLTPRRTQGGSSWGNATLQIRALRKEFLLHCLQASQHLPARLLPRLRLFIPAMHCQICLKGIFWEQWQFQG